MNNEHNIYDIFSRLTPNKGLDGCFQVEQIHPRLPHKIGISDEDYPLIFVECQDDKLSTDINLEMFKVHFNRVCNLSDGKNTLAKKYTIIELRSKNEDFQKYFFEVVLLVLLTLDPYPLVCDLKKEVGKLISLFTTKTQLSKDVVKGLWAELFVIHESKNPSYLIQSWHISPEDKYDFNDGIDKLEVKSTNTDDRIHHFAIEQLHPNEGSDLLIASVILTTSGIGMNIFDLLDGICSNISIADASKLHQVVMQTIGIHIDSAKVMTFDYAYAKSNYKKYNYLDIPSISLDAVPSLVTSVHFASCLKNIQEVDTKKMNNKLFRAL